MARRDQDWMRQADRDLDLADLARRNGIHEWSCFGAQQAAEKAVKALHLALGQEAWGRVVRALLEALPGDVPIGEDLLDRARILDGYYVPTRYANRRMKRAARWWCADRR